jgi:hypothetical protein
MANNYCQFSEVLSCGSKEEAQWVSRISQLALDYSLEQVEVGPDWNDDFEPITEDAKLAADIVDGGFNGCGFSFKIEDDSNVWFYAEECGDPGFVAEIVFEYFKKFNKKECFSISYAETCERPRVGEFGGGALFVTLDGIKFMNSYTWIQEQTDKFKE